ncbi:hypothetical protein ACK3BE_33275 (plasmid) [Pseudomonas mandelii]|uniref:hypothetical protein n=1 Tax=Pseudomonas mandelii TaxID=75612 RepID=UPI00398C876D
MREHLYTDEELDVWGDLYAELKHRNRTSDVRFSEFLRAPWNYLHHLTPAVADKDDSVWVARSSAKIRRGAIPSLRLIPSS